MMGFFSKLFGSDKIIDAGVNGIDAMFFTDEEKSNAKMQFLKLYEPYKLAQRYLALIYSIPYALAWLVTFIASFFVDVALQMELLKGDAFYINIVILSFYFGGGAAEGIVKQIKGK
jgi:hypothetical protein